MPRQSLTIEELLRRFSGSPNACWVSDHSAEANGYVRLRVRQADGRVSRESIHRAAFEHAVGPIGDGASLNHRCANRACFNPRHLGVIVHPTKQPASVESRLGAHRGGTSECWVGPWRPARNGYVRIWLRAQDRKPGRHGESALVHRLAYELWRGPIPVRMQIDHRCRNRACFNPAHLVIATACENNRRSNSPSALNAVKVRCKRGHPLAGGNVRLFRESNGALGRACRACDRMNAAMSRIGDPAVQAALAARYRADIAEAMRDGPRRAVPARCKHGHPYDAENTYFYFGTYARVDGTRSVQRACRICRTEAGRRYQPDPEKYARKQERKNTARRAARRTNVAKQP